MNKLSVCSTKMVGEEKAMAGLILPVSNLANLKTVWMRSQGWAIPGSEHQYYTQYYTGQKLLNNTNTQYQYYTESQSTIQVWQSSASACLRD